MQTMVYVFSLSKLEAVLVQPVGWPSNHEPQTLWLSFISNGVFISLKILLSAGQNISSKKWLCDLSFDEDYNISPMLFHSQHRDEHTLGKKKMPCKIISLSMRQTFLL